MHSSPTQQRAFQHILLTIRQAGARSVTFTSAESGVQTSVFAEGTALIASTAGLKTLLCVGTDSSPKERPVIRMPNVATDATQVRSGVAAAPVKVNQLALPPSVSTDVARASSFVQAQASVHDLVIFQLPALLEPAPVSPLEICAACDMVFLACSLGSTRQQELAAARQLLEQSRITLSGVVVDAFSRRTPGEEIAAFVDRLWFLGRRRRERWKMAAATSDLLN